MISVSESNILIIMMQIECAKWRDWHKAHNDTYWVLKIGFTPQRLVPFVVQRAVSDSADIEWWDKVHTYTPSAHTHKLQGSFTGFDTFDCIWHHRSTQDM